MHDINPLGTTMHLRELERQAAPRVREVPSGKTGHVGLFAMGASVVALLKRLNASSVSVRGETQVSSSSFK